MGYESQFSRELTSLRFEPLARRVFDVASFFTFLLFFYSTITFSLTEVHKNSFHKTECLIVELAPFSSNPGSTCHGYKMYTLQVVGQPYNFTGSPLVGVDLQTRFKIPDDTDEDTGKRLFDPEAYVLGKQVKCFILISGSLESLEEEDRASSADVKLGFHMLWGPRSTLIITAMFVCGILAVYGVRSEFCGKGCTKCCEETSRENANSFIENRLLDDVQIEAISPVERDSFLEDRFTPKDRENHLIDWHQRLPKSRTNRTTDAVALYTLGVLATVFSLSPFAVYVVDIFSFCDVDIGGLISAFLWAIPLCSLGCLTALSTGRNEMYGYFDTREMCFVLKKPGTLATEKREMSLPFDRMKTLKMGTYTDDDGKYGVLYLEYEYRDEVDGLVVEYGELDTGSEQGMKFEYLKYKEIFQKHCRASWV